jgi:hypothetical protein
MADGERTVNLRAEIEGLLDCLDRGDNFASVHLARLIEADTHGALQPFAEALTARLCDHISRYAELGENDPYITLENEVYRLIRDAAVDWNGHPKTGRAGEEA